MNRGPKRAFTRMWLDDTLKAQDFDSIKEFLRVYRNVDDKERIGMLQIIWDRLYPKARPVDEDGQSGPDISVQLTPEELRELARAARGEE